MTAPGLNDSEIAASSEGASSGVTAESFVELARGAVREAFLEDPGSTEPQPATVTSIAEAPSMRRQQAGAEAMGGEASLAAKPVPVNAEGRVVDMEQYRRVERARAEVASSYPTIPETPQIENLL